MIYRLKIAYSTITLWLLFLFALGVETGFLLDFAEAENRFQRIRQSLEETATWEP